MAGLQTGPGCYRSGDLQVGACLPMWFQLTCSQMKKLLTSALLLCAFSLSAQAPTPVPLAHGDVPGEPHHHVKIENEYVRVYYVEVPPHENTQLHQHDHDYLFVTLGDSDVINAVRDKPEVHLVLKDGETHFTRGGFAHVARNLADTPFRNVTIELMKPQEKPRNLCANVVLDSPVTGVCGAPRPNAPNFRTALFETDGILAEYDWLGPDADVLRVKKKADRLLVVFDQSRLRAEMAGVAPMELRGGDSLWLPAESDPAFENLLEAASSRFLLISFKTIEPAKKP